MKRALSTLIVLLTLSLVCHAEPYFPGAWYATKGSRQAGAIEVNFYFDNTLTFDIFLGGDYLETVEGTYIDTGKYLLFTIVDSEGWVWQGKYNAATGLLTGKFVSVGGQTKGKFQATLEDDGLESTLATNPDKKVAPATRKSATP